MFFEPVDPVHIWNWINLRVAYDNLRFLLPSHMWNKGNSELLDIHIFPALLSSCLQSSALRLFILCIINLNLSYCRLQESCLYFIGAFLIQPEYICRQIGFTALKVFIKIGPNEFGMSWPQFFNWGVWILNRTSDVFFFSSLRER